MSTTAVMAAEKTLVRFQDHGAYAWMWSQAPCCWRGKVELQFITVPLRLLEPAESLRDPAVVDKWLSRVQSGRPIPPPIVSATERGTFYLHEGNHRYDAMQTFFAGDGNADIRVALALPKPDFQFRFRWFGTYGTYLLEPVPVRIPPPRIPLTGPALAFRGRVLVLVAHPDDETGGCGGLLQRLSDPVVLFASDGAPADEFFWKSYGSQRNYALVRRHEATTALAAAGVAQVEFLNDGRTGVQFTDQELYRNLPRAFEAVRAAIEKHQPDSVIVPAYEGGHPDHDSCSFLGYLVRVLLGLPVWEMPLYHRSDEGELVCQRFRETNGSEIMLALSPDELRTREVMVANYRSQVSANLAQFAINPSEYYRPQPDYDYSLPPHAGIVNYEAWQWRMPPAEVCQYFSDCIRQLGQPPPAEREQRLQQCPRPVPLLAFADPAV